MTNYDPDPDLQCMFNNLYALLPPINWRQWLDITDIRDYEALTLHLSGLSSVENISERIRNSPSQTLLTSKNPSHDEARNPSDPLVLCHSSGTSTQNLAAIKWYALSRELVSRLWAPGMQAIFESSGVSSRSHVAIFVPSRLSGDGLSVQEGKPVIRLYSSEFSQRLVLALLKPTQYFFNHYRNSQSLPYIAQLLAMKHIDVLSAPASTILGWAHTSRLRRGLQRSIQSHSKSTLAEIADSLDIPIKKFDASHLEAFTQYIQERLQEVLVSATLIFSTSSLSEADWTLLRAFMNWSSDTASYTNLYVGSEIGPFAASLRKKVSDPSHDTMLVFPLTVSTLQIDHQFQLLSRCPAGWGRLYTSHLRGGRPMINIDVGDIVHLLPITGYPMIQGKILRAAFPLKQSPTIFLPIPLPQHFSTYVGDYFSLNTHTIIDPQALRARLVQCGIMKKTASLVLAPHPSDGQGSWILFIPHRQMIDATDGEIQLCLKDMVLAELPDMPVSIHLLPTNPIHPPTPRQALVQKVQRGEAPKGVLKRWPLYIIQAVN
jgi:hypothetical protein